MFRRPTTCAQHSRRCDPGGPPTTVTWVKLPRVQNRHELMLTRRRAVDLCRLGGCCCPC
ncbi:putative leader peptide [Rhodococcus gordoniae]|uniref:putative leader peptide n=1 Tax=Rhodococcus gordoniae TaxID=223392 RepID=UPI0034C6D838